MSQPAGREPTQFVSVITEQNASRPILKESQQATVRVRDNELLWTRRHRWSQHLALRGPIDPMVIGTR